MSDSVVPTAEDKQALADHIANLSDLVKLRYSVRDWVFFPRQLARSLLAGGQRSSFRGRGMDFEEVRHYLPGDDIRAIDWRVTARTKQPHTKVFREERERPVFIIVDMRLPMLFGGRELKATSASKIAAALGWAGLNANDRVGALLFGCRSQIDIRPKRSHHNVLQLIKGLHQLAHELPDAEQDHYQLEQIVEEARRIAHPGSSVFIISDFHDINRSSEKHLHELARHSDLTLCHVFDELEQQLPPAGLYPILNDDQRQLLDTRDGNLNTLWQQQFSERNEALQRFCGSLGIGKLSFSTAEDVLAKLSASYSKRRKRRAK